MIMETYNTNDEIVCPYCGHVIKATPDNVGNYDLEFNDEEFECEKCEKKHLSYKDGVFLVTKHLKRNKKE